MRAEGLGEPCGAGATVGELAIGELRLVSAGALFCATDAWARLTHGSQLSAAVNLMLVHLFLKCMQTLKNHKLSSKCLILVNQILLYSS